MASDQTLPNSSISSKKQQQLEAGKKRLEEFRKKKAAAKKAASSNSANGNLQPPVSGTLDVVDEKKTKDVDDANPLSSFDKLSESLEQAFSTAGKMDHGSEELKNTKLGYGVDVEESRAFHHPEVDFHSTSNTRLEDAFKIPSTAQPPNGPTYRDSSSEGVLEHGYNPVSAVDYQNHVNESSSSLWSPESLSTSFRSEVVASHNQTSMSAGRKSRPSFLDSINVARNSYAEADKPNPLSSKIHPLSYSSAGNVGDLFRQNEVDISFNSTSQNEDFAALEQHIEDLTQEKFSLQRALEASRVLAESLATENSALTDTYNQQGGVVNQLKFDMERLQEEMKAQLVELEAVRTEYGNARLECSAADERAKLLASEVIGLEEKALRLRSNELKLERQLENIEAEMSSHKRRISSLEKDRQDLQSTIDALQEEKKVLQSKLRKAPAIGNSVDINKRKEASTCTDDLVDEESQDTTRAALGENDALHLGFDVSSWSIPPDQTRMIQNINTLISELALEKQELMQALSTESSQTSKLKDLNKELSQKLEAQTQRLELLTSQSNIPPRKSSPPTHTVVDNTPYADEGDEVVERVLGWIMKLFPGGPSRRQTKHL